MLDLQRMKLYLRSNVRLINKLNTIHETIDSKPYVMPIYRNGFIGVESYTKE